MRTRKLAWAMWTVMPVVLIAWAFGPGADARARERVAGQLELARAAEEAGEHELVRDALATALAELPAKDEDARRRLELRHADALLACGELWPAVDLYEALLGELEPSGSAPVQTVDPLAREVRHQLATARYFAAWLMRLEGGTSDEWLPEAHKARQHFALLASRAELEDSPEKLAFEKNVEAVVRLELMDLSELQAMPLPKKCPDCTGGLCKSKSGCKGGQCRGGKQPSDARAKLNEGAGANRAEGAGS